MKKLMSVLLATLLLLTMLPLSVIGVSAEDEIIFYNEGDFSYIIENGEAIIIGPSRAKIEGRLVIPSTLGGYPVTAIGDHAFWNQWYITSVELADSVTHIGEQAFDCCYNLTSIHFGSGVENFAGAFIATGDLQTLTVSKDNPYYCSENNTVFSKDKTVLYLVPSVERFVIPDGVTTVKYLAYTAYGIKELCIPTSVKEIEPQAMCGNAFENVYYMGSEEQAKEIQMGPWNVSFNNATWHYNYKPTPVSITKEPATGYAKMGEKASVKVTAKGDGLTYQWYIKNNGAKKYSKSSITSATYSTTMSDKAKDRLVYCIVKDAFGNEVKAKTVRLREAVSITKVPATAAYAKKGDKVSVKITASGDGLKYAWYVKNEGGTKYSKSSVTSATYSATMGSKVKGRRVYCVVTDKYGKTVQSKTFLLREAVSITTQPKTVSVKKNATAKVTVKAFGDGLKYTWYIKNEGQNKYSKSSVTSASYSTTMNSKSKNRLLYCVVTDKYGNTVKSTTVKLKMK